MGITHLPVVLNMGVLMLRGRWSSTWCVRARTGACVPVRFGLRRGGLGQSRVAAVLRVHPGGFLIDILRFLGVWCSTSLPIASSSDLRGGLVGGAGV
ncbi:hypothetical protein C2E23DRAFT_831214 [Lenzites betulinus]|nr:hypothetical protein C2E23DRAFT_831214 [Lenzites betulinus]